MVGVVEQWGVWMGSGYGGDKFWKVIVEFWEGMGGKKMLNVLYMRIFLGTGFPEMQFLMLLATGVASEQFMSFLTQGFAERSDMVSITFNFTFYFFYRI